MATPFSQVPQTAPADPARAAALRGIQERSASAAPAPAGPAPAGPPPGAGVSDMFVQLTQAIVQAGLTPEVIAAFEDFIAFFQQLVQQTQGATGGGAPPQQALPQGQGQAGPPPQAAGPPLPPG